MKSKVMNRPMFLDVENVGIMQGFKDDDYEDMNEGYESSSMMDRTPSSPEILMNNLRGDMRSVDARIEELAQLVGEDVAMQTPPEVLALLQPVLAAQEGIASLPAGMPTPPMGASPPMSPSPMEATMPAPDMGMMPPEMGMMPPEMGMPPGPPPTAQAPLQMAQGGLVQRFRDGSDEEGVTPARPTPPVTDPSSARALLMNLRNQNLPSLQEEYESLLPTYQQALGGGDRKMTQAQMLFDIAQAGLNLAAGTDSQGRRVPAGASFASSLAAAAQGLPERIAERSGQMEQQEIGTRLAALKGAEASQVARLEAMKGESLFGKGDWEWNIINRPGLMDRWASGEVTPEEDSLVQSALSKLSQPRTEFRADPVTGQPMPVLVPAVIPGFVQEAIGKRNLSSTPGTAPTSRAPTAEEQINETIVRDAQGNVIDFGRTVQESRPTGEETLREGAVVRDGQAPATYSLTNPTMFNLASKGTGIINVPATMIANIPLLGEFVNADEQIQAKTFLDNAVNQLNRAIATNPRFAEGERVQIQQELKLAPAAIDRPDAYRQRIIGLDTLLIELRNKAYTTGYKMPDLAPNDVAAARLKVGEIDQLRQLIGAPPRVYSKEARDQLPTGSYYLWQGSQLAIKR